MHPYLFLQEEVLKKGHPKGDRTKTGTLSLPGLVRRYDIRHETPAIVSTKKLHIETGLVEEQWMMSGDTDVKFLKENNCNIWDDWVNDPNAVYRPRTVKEMRRVYTRNHFQWALPDVMAYRENYADADWTGVYAGEHFIIWEVVQEGKDPYHCLVETYKGSIDLIHWTDREDPVWLDFYRALGISDQEVVSGDLGAVYGKMFRSIPDVRMIEPSDDAQHLALSARGFEYMGSMTPVSDDVTTKDIYHRNIDQVGMLLRQFESGDYDSRRLILCPWNPAYIDEQALPPCHSFIQFWTRDLTPDERFDIYIHRNERMQQEVLQRAAENPECLLSNMYTNVTQIPKTIWFNDKNTTEEATAKMVEFLDHMDIPKKALTCILFQRSADIFLGVPYNLTFYSILTHKLARQFNMWGEELIHMLGDGHIYANHVDQVKLQQGRIPLQPPYLRFNKPVGTSILDYTFKDVELVGYNSYPAIPAPIAV